MKRPASATSSQERLPRATLLGIALVAASVLLLEISLTRYFSFRLWYHYAFMIISIALLGLSSAAGFLALMRERIAARPPHRVLAAGAWLAGAAVLVALPLLSLLNRMWVRESGPVWQVFLLVALYWLVLFVPFFFSGCTLSWSIETYAEKIGRVYAFDLAGAAAGCLATVALLSRFHAEQCMAFAAAASMVAALMFLLPFERPARATYAIAAIGAVALAAALFGGGLIGAAVTPTKGLARDLRSGGKLVATRPGMTGRVDVVAGRPSRGFAWGLVPQRGERFPPQLFVRIDGDALTTITRFNGDLSSWAFAERMPSTLPYAMRQHRRVLVIGPGGGMDVVNGLERGAEEVVGVEINKGIIDLMRGQFDEFAGGVYRDPRVRIVHSDGRNFVERSGETFDLIQLTLVDTFAAISSGALSLSEDFLYTLQAFEAYTEALEPDGYLVLGRTVVEGLPLAVLLDAATRGLGIDLGRHLLIADQPELVHSLVFVFKRSPLSAEEIRRALSFIDNAGLRLVYAPGAAGNLEGVAAEFLAHPDRDRFIAESALDLEPETDDRPFYFRASKWSSLLGTYTGGRGNLLIIFAVSILFALGFIVAPLQMVSPTGLRTHGRPLLYFAFIGLGFIVLEIGLMVKLALFLGHPVRSITVTLFSLLLFSGLGSRLSSRVVERGDGSAGERLTRAAMTPLVGVAVLAVSGAYLLDDLLAAWMGLRLALRVGLAILLVAPLGLLMGMPLPLGMSLLRRRSRSLVLWAWGANGFASVVGSIGCVLLAHMAGYRSAFLVAAVCYLAALMSVARSRLDHPGATRGNSTVS